MANPLVAISVSESPDGQLLGADQVHLHRLSADIAELFLSLGFDLAYGGDLRGGGFTETLIDIVSDEASRLEVTDGRLREPRLVSYLAWPYVETLSVRDRALLQDTCRFRSILPGEVGWRDDDLDPMRALGKQTRTPRDAWMTTTCLSKMRRVMSRGDEDKGIRPADLRIVLGGRTTGMAGLMPGVVEEGLIAIEDETPLVILGGYGGGAAVLARAIFQGDLSETLEPDHQKQFSPFSLLLEESVGSGYEAPLPDIDQRYGDLRSALLTAKDAAAIRNNGLCKDANLALASAGQEALGVGDEEHILQLLRVAGLAVLDRC